MNRYLPQRCSAEVFFVNKIWYLLGTTDFIMISTTISPKYFFFCCCCCFLRCFHQILLGPFQYINAELLHATGEIAREISPESSFQLILIDSRTLCSSGPMGHLQG